MVHQDAHGLVKLTSYIKHEWSCLIKLAILIWLTNLLAMPTEIPTYLFNIYLFTNLNIFYLRTYLATIYLLMSYLVTYLTIIYLLTTIYLLFTEVIYLFTY
jgi:hypothetical protein